MQKFDGSVSMRDLSSNLENWRLAEELSSAFYVYSEAHQRSKFERATDPGEMATYKLLMYADLFLSLSRGERRALGFRTEPTVSDGPIPIPTHCFDQNPQVNECDEGKITASGWKYERVKISSLPAGEAVKIFEKTSEYSRTGRPTTYHMSKEVLIDLLKLEANRTKSAEKLHPEFAREFERHFPRDEWQVSTPIPRTLRDHIKRLRQELAETGKN